MSEGSDMTPEERIAKILKAAFVPPGDKAILRFYRADILSAIHAAVAAEREACAEVAEQFDTGSFLGAIPKAIANTIRERGEGK